jgi:hypothetical protein
MVSLGTVHAHAHLMACPTATCHCWAFRGLPFLLALGPILEPSGRQVGNVAVLLVVVKVGTVCGMWRACVRAFVQEATMHGRGHVQGQLACTIATDQSRSGHPGQGCDPWSWRLLMSPRGGGQNRGHSFEGAQ